MSNPCELCRQQMLELLPPRDVSTQLLEAQSADETMHADADARREMEAHLATCPDCTREWTRLQNMTQAMHSIPMTSAPVDLRARIRSQIVDERTAQEQTAKKSFWQSLTFRPQRVAWAGSVVVGGLLLVLAAQQPIEFYPSASTPSASLEQAPAPQQPESALRIEQKDVQKPAPKIAVRKATPSASQNRQRASAGAQNSTSAGASTNNAADAETSATTSNEPVTTSPNLQPALPADIPSAPIEPPGNLKPSAPQEVQRPQNQNRRAAVQPPFTVQRPATKTPDKKTSKTATRPNASTQNAAAPENAGQRSAAPELFTTSPAPAPKPPSTPRALKLPQRDDQSASQNEPPTMAKSAPETMMAPPVTRAETREGTQNAAQESEPNTASSPNAVAPGATAPRESTRTREGISAMRNAPAGSSAAGSAPPMADSAPESFAARNEADSKQRVFVVATRFIPSRDVKTARLRVVLPSGATLASSSTQDLVVWQGKARAGIAIPITMSMRADSSSGSLRLVLEEKRGSSWRSVQERTIALEP